MSAAQSYDEFVQAHGHPIFGTESVGLTREHAITAIELARAEGVQILGGDVFLRDEDSVHPAYANWYVNHSAGEGAREYSMRSCDEAERYVQEYPKSDRDNLLFVLVVPALPPERA